jgi:hypothetical protein
VHGGHRSVVVGNLRAMVTVSVGLDLQNLEPILVFRSSPGPGSSNETMVCRCYTVLASRQVVQIVPTRVEPGLAM